MAKISDELRRLTNSDSVRGHTFVALQDIADRIDAELVELPKDADGVPIHVGDTVYMDDGRMAEVYSIEFKNGETNVLCRTPSGCYVSSGYVYRLPNKLTHTRPDSLERIAQDMEDWAERYRFNSGGGIFNYALDFADRIRKLAKEQGNE